MNAPATTEIQYHPFVPGETHPNLKLMSNSGNEVLHGCAKRYQLDKLLLLDNVSTTDTIFGAAVGAGVQKLLATRNRNLAYLAALTAWEGSIFDEEDKAVRNHKLFWHCLNAIDLFYQPLNSVFQNMELAILNSRPATELGFIIDCGDGFYYRGFIDAVLIDRGKKEIVVIDLKTTGSTAHEANYKYSGQLLGYSLIIDFLVAELAMELESSYRVYYPVFQSTKAEWVVFDFIKNHTNKALWIKNLLIDKRHILEYSEDNHFPMRGEFCYSYFKVCPHYAICELKVENIARNPRLKIEKANKYDYSFSLEQIILNQLEQYGEL